MFPPKKKEKKREISNVRCQLFSFLIVRLNNVEMKIGTRG